MVFSISIAFAFVFFLKYTLFRLAITLILSTFYTKTIQLLPKCIVRIGFRRLMPSSGCRPADYWNPYEWVMSLLSGPQQSYSAPVNSCLRLLWSQFISYLVFISSCCLLYFLALLSFQRILPFHNVPKVGWLQFVIFIFSDVSGLFVSGPTCSSFWQFRVSVELSSNSIFQINHFFPL